VRPFCAILAIAGVFAARGIAPRLLFAAASSIALAPVMVPYFGKYAPGTLRIYSKNLLVDNQQVDALAQDILAAKPALVMLQEVSPRNESILELLREDFPHQHRCNFAEKWLSIALLSRHAFAGEPRCTKDRALAAAPVDLEGQPFWAVSVHAPWPWPKPTASHEEEALRLLQQLDAPIVMAGDLNTLPWTHRVTAMQAASSTTRAGPPRASLSLGPLPLAIDMAFAPGGGSLMLRPKLGSDHAGLVADLSLAGAKP
jgi:endonuclease/exonuclease/phosphatase (EEP) superfamily protein YafD